MAVLVHAHRGLLSLVPDFADFLNCLARQLGLDDAAAQLSLNELDNGKEAKLSVPEICKTNKHALFLRTDFEEVRGSGK